MGVPSQQEGTLPSFCLPTLEPMCSNKPSLFLPTHFHTHKFSCLLCNEDVTGNASSKEVTPYLDGLVHCPRKKVGHPCVSAIKSSLQIQLSIPLTCAALCIGFMTDMPVFVFAPRLQTWQHGPGGKAFVFWLEPPKHRHLVPGLLLLLKGKENICDFTPLNLTAFSSVEWGQ